MRASRGLSLTLCLALAGIACGPPDADGIHDPAECRDCRVELTQVVSLTSEDAAGEARYPATLARNASGAYFVAPTHVPGAVAMYDASGVFMGSLGRHGRGPGEMRSVESVNSWFGDSVVVIHDMNQFLVYGADTAAPRVGRFESTSFILRYLTPVTGNNVLAVRYGTGGGEDQPIREFSLTGKPVRGYGDSILYGMGNDHAAITMSGDTIWAAKQRSYEIDAFLRSTGQKVRTVTRHIDWFPPDAERLESGGVPEVVDIARDPSGRLWVLLSRPRAEFRLTQAPRPTSGPVRARTGGSMSIGLIRERFEYVLEILDLERGALIAAQSLGEAVPQRFLDGEHLYGYEEHPDTGSLSVVLWRLNVTNGS